MKRYTLVFKGGAAVDVKATQVIFDAGYHSTTIHFGPDADGDGSDVLKYINKEDLTAVIERGSLD